MGTFHLDSTDGHGVTAKIAGMATINHINEIPNRKKKVMASTATASKAKQMRHAFAHRCSIPQNEGHVV